MLSSSALVPHKNPAHLLHMHSFRNPYWECPASNSLAVASESLAEESKSVVDPSMKPVLILICPCIFLATMGVARAATITVTNQTQDSYAVLNRFADPIPRGSGYIAIGTFSIDDATLRNIIEARDLGAILEGFSQFGNSLTMGSRVNGYYQDLIRGVIADGDGISGSTVYTMITESSSLELPAGLIVYKHEGVTFQPDPSITPDIVLRATPSNLVYGFETRVVINGQERIGVCDCIPEPTTPVFFLLSASFFVRRRCRLFVHPS